MGTTQTLTIKSTARTLAGSYYLWLGTPTGNVASDDKENDTTFMLVKGDITERNTREVTVSFTVPEIPKNTAGYILTFYNAKLSSEGPAFTFWLKIEPGIKVSPASATPGNEVTVSGNGFPANEKLAVDLDGKPLGTEIISNNLGSFSITFTLPDTIAGQHQVFTEVPDAYDIEAKANLNVVPHIILEPDQPDVGSEAIITGRGFAGRSPISIEYDGTEIASSPTTDDMGNFNYTFKVPKASQAQHEVLATDKAGNKASLSGGELKLEGEAPSAPQPTTPTDQRFGMFGPQVVRFAWSEVSDPSGITYTLEIAENLNFFPLAPGMRKTNLKTTNTMVSLKPGTYYWRVRAVDGAGNESPWALSPYPFKVGAISITYLIIGILLLLLIIVFVVRAAFRRIREQYR